jgi:hypothetical protein
MATAFSEDWQYNNGNLYAYSGRFSSLYLIKGIHIREIVIINKQFHQFSGVNFMKHAGKKRAHSLMNLQKQNLLECLLFTFS